MATAKKPAPADLGWLARNLGMATALQGMPGAAAPPGPPTAAEEQARMRELIDFDSEGPVGRAFLTAAPLAHGLSKFVEIPWPAGLAPKPTSKPTGPKLPPADVLIVTWTVDEGHALSRVLTPGF